MFSSDVFLKSLMGVSILTAGFWCLGDSSHQQQAEAGQYADGVHVEKLLGAEGGEAVSALVSGYDTHLHIYLLTAGRAHST